MLTLSKIYAVKTGRPRIYIFNSNTCYNTLTAKITLLYVNSWNGIPDSPYDIGCI